MATTAADLRAVKIKMVDGNPVEVPVEPEVLAREEELSTEARLAWKAMQNALLYHFLHNEPDNMPRLADADGLAVRECEGRYNGWVKQNYWDNSPHKRRIICRRAVGFSVETGESPSFEEAFKFIIQHWNEIAVPYPEGGAFPLSVVTIKKDR